MRPFIDILHESMLHRVAVNVIDVLFKVIVVADRVFPEPPLPKTALAFAPSGRFVWRRDRAREMTFQQSPPGRNVLVIRRHRPNAVKMIGQDDDRDRLEWMAFAHIGIRAS